MQYWALPWRLLICFLAAAEIDEDVLAEVDDEPNEDELAEVQDGGDVESEWQNRCQLCLTRMVYYVLKEQERAGVNAYR